MRRLTRLLGAMLIATAVFVAVSERSVEARRNLCYIMDVNYFEDSSCSNVVGIRQYNCNGQLVNSWGSETSQYQSEKFGGSLCGCSGEDWYQSQTVGCSLR
jgi:hypothetical protein